MESKPNNENTQQENGDVNDHFPFRVINSQLSQLQPNGPKRLFVSDDLCAITVDFAQLRVPQ